MKNSLIVALVGLAVFYSCSKKQGESPYSIISKDTMALVITDLHIVDAAISLNSFDMSATDFDKQKLYAQVFKQHKVTKAKFNKSFKCYSENLAEINEIYKEVIIALSKKQAEVSKQ